ncbi:hypothetical protein P3T36_002275 [Kitasatospora sp. MAP12-15]|uniref:hypothetical protein n=1 Tax=unclassified Kitasatospora TaxID=2633591 RepID=UPI00247412AB|nr:hypothetical protein [Kitasatospora sp. MAP12-44]MDH6108804.1 hypothetical protein [Kitasatospora sp. MAP12-44]
MGLLFVGFFALVFVGVPGVVVLSIVLAVRAGRRSAGSGQPPGRPGRLDWLPEQDDLQRRAQSSAWSDGGSTEHPHGHGHEHHQHHHTPSPSPSFDSSPSPSPSHHHP